MNLGGSESITSNFSNIPNIQKTSDTKTAAESVKLTTASFPAKSNSTPKDSVTVSSNNRPANSYFNKMLNNRERASVIMSSVNSNVAFVKALENAVRNAVSSVYSLLKNLEEENSISDEKEKLYLLELLMKLEGQFTYQHSCRVTDLSMSLAERLNGDPQLKKEIKDGAMFKELGFAAVSYAMSDEEEQSEISSFMSSQLKSFRDAGELHDIGKIQIPAHIVNKPDKLTDAEFEVMKQHPILGEALLKPIKSMAHVLPTVRHHHERWDGKGYPDEIKDQKIPLSARIIAVTDSFDAMISERPYKKAMTVSEAVDELIKNSGTQFAPDIVVAFISLLKEKGELERSK